MSKKFAVCFSGYPRFVKSQFNNIKTNFLDGLGDYDIYAKFQWSEDWKNIQIHHEYSDKFETNELEDFKELYGPLNLKKIETTPPYNFDKMHFPNKSAESDMFLTEEQSKDVSYRIKCQFQGIVDCVKIVDNPLEYDYFVRMRTDLIFLSEIEMKNLETSTIMNQDGFVAGADRPNSDWFFITPSNQIKFYDDLTRVEELFKDGVRHTHKVLEEVGKSYGMKHYEFYVRTPTATGGFSQNLLKKPTGNYTVIKRT